MGKNTHIKCCIHHQNVRQRTGDTGKMVMFGGVKCCEMFKIIYIYKKN